MSTSAACVCGGSDGKDQTKTGYTPQM